MSSFCGNLVITIICTWNVGYDRTCRTNAMLKLNCSTQLFCSQTYER